MKLSFMCTILLVTLNGWAYSEDRCIYVLDTINRIVDRCHLTNPGKVQYLHNLKRGRRGRDRMIVEFTTTYAIRAYHH